jgi:hypothetical protein
VFQAGFFGGTPIGLSWYVDASSPAGASPWSGFGGRPLLHNPTADLDQGNAHQHHGDPDDLLEGKRSPRRGTAKMAVYITPEDAKMLAA